MVGKSFVSALQEYCDKNHLELPSYCYINNGEQGGFECRITLLGREAHGTGRSKRDAKHFCASNMMKLIGVDHPESAEFEEMPTTDMVLTLRDYCVQHNHPLPEFSIIQQGGTPDAPEFICLCTIATITRYGVSYKKKDARQKAAFNMYRVIMNDEINEEIMTVATVQQKTTDTEVERRQKFKTYRELVESNEECISGVMISDRHNYFKDYYQDLRNEANSIIAKKYDVIQVQSMDIFKALKLIPNIEYQDAAISEDRFVIITCDSDYKFVLAGLESTIWQKVVQYFRDMIN